MEIGVLRTKETFGTEKKILKSFFVPFLEKKLSETEIKWSWQTKNWKERPGDIFVNIFLIYYLSLEVDDSPCQKMRKSSCCT